MQQCHIVGEPISDPALQWLSGGSRTEQPPGRLWARLVLEIIPGKAPVIIANQGSVSAAHIRIIP